MTKRLLIIFFLCPILILNAQEDKEDVDKGILYIENEILLGKAVPHVSRFPKTGLHWAYHLSIGRYFNHPNSINKKAFNNPYAGIKVGYHNLGNTSMFGHQFTLSPFITIGTSPKPYKGVQFHFALGANYFTKKYDDLTNPDNLFIGSHVTWSYQTFLYKTFSLKKKNNLKIGLGFVHASNGHTELPNYGVNSFVFSMAWQNLLMNNKDESLESTIGSNEIEPLDRTRHHFISIYQGFGTHELGGPINPRGGKDRAVLTSSVTYSWLFKRFINLRTGLAYRYYHQYHHYINNNTIHEYSSNPIYNASNIIAILGVEFYLGRFGIDIESGINITKPFYKEHFEVFENTGTYDWVTKRFFPAQLGVFVYLTPPHRLPQHNLSLGAHIHANFGQADFSSLTLKYTKRLD